jgi:hypothetical protein
MGLFRWRPTRPVHARLTALRFRLDLDTPTASFGPALAVRTSVQPRVSASAGSLAYGPLPHRCQIPSVRALGQDFHLRFVIHASHTPDSPCCQHAVVESKPLRLRLFGEQAN